MNGTISILTGRQWRINETPTYGDMQDEAYADYLYQMEETQPDATPLSFDEWLPNSKSHVEGFCQMFGVKANV